MSSKFDTLLRLDITYGGKLDPETQEAMALEQITLFANSHTEAPFKIFYPETEHLAATTEDDYDVLELVDGIIVNVDPTDMPEGSAE